GEGVVYLAPRSETCARNLPLGDTAVLPGLPNMDHETPSARLSGLKGMACRRDHEVAGLADGHEVAHHLSMRHRQRSAGFDLCLEFRHHRTVRGKQIAETHRDQSHGALVCSAATGEVIIERLAIHLGKAL